MVYCACRPFRPSVHMHMRAPFKSSVLAIRARLRTTSDTSHPIQVNYEIEQCVEVAGVFWAEIVANALNMRVDAQLFRVRDGVSVYGYGGGSQQQQQLAIRSDSRYVLLFPTSLYKLT